MNVTIALGSNLGDRLVHLQESVRQLGKIATVTRKAAVYESSPVDCDEGTPAFYNTVVEIETSLHPLELLAQTQRIQIAMGRPKDQGFHQPRTIDIDLLFTDSLTIDHEDLQLPHPRFRDRQFVLVPLVNINETYRHDLERIRNNGEVLTLAHAEW